MRILRVIPWDKLRKEYHQERLRKQAWLRAIKEVIKAVLLGILVGAPIGTMLAVWRVLLWIL